MILTNQEQVKPIETLYIPIGGFGNQASFEYPSEAKGFAFDKLCQGHCVKLVVLSAGTSKETYVVMWGS